MDYDYYLLTFVVEPKLGTSTKNLSNFVADNIRRYVASKSRAIIEKSVVTVEWVNQQRSAISSYGENVPTLSGRNDKMIVRFYVYTNRKLSLLAKKLKTDCGVLLVEQLSNDTISADTIRKHHQSAIAILQ